MAKMICQNDSTLMDKINVELCEDYTIKDYKCCICDNSVRIVD